MEQPGLVDKLRTPWLMSRPQKNAAFFALDLLLVPVSLWLGYIYRLGFERSLGWAGWDMPFPRVDWFDATAIVLISAAIIATAQLYRIRLRSFDLSAAMRIAATGAVLMVVVPAWAFFSDVAIPRSVAIYYGLNFIGLAILARLSILQVLNRIQTQTARRTPVAIYGAGLAGIQLAASLTRSPEVTPVMFVDDNPALHGVIVSGLTVRPVETLEKSGRNGRIKQVLIATASLPRQKREALVARMAPLGVDVKIMPSYIDLISGRSKVTEFRSVNTDDLLGRDSVDLNVPEIAKAYAGRTILVTGAGGSIGSELCRQLVDCAPRHLILFERSEFNLYEVERNLGPLCEAAGIALTIKLASVTDRPAVEAVLNQDKVDVVLHAAAYKHVPIVECNEVEGVRNNVLGTHVVAEAAARAGVERFILVSTDKAVRPTNIMGVTKRLAELVVGDLQARYPNTKYAMVRFGNVLGSSGSVVPLFRAQIETGGPLTVTDTRVTRYFMTISEASRLVLLAGAFSTGNDLFVLNMGEPIRIIDLARRMIELSGKTVLDDDNPDGDIAIEIIGLRPGEKLFEELLIDDEALSDTPHAKIMRATFAGLSQIEVARMIKQAQDAVDKRDAGIVRDTVARYVNGYQEKGLSNV